MPERAGVEMPEQSGPGEWGCEEWTDAERQERVIVENAIRQAFELDKLYLDPELNLPILAKHISKSPAVVSSVINKELGESFRGMVNTYRVEAVKLRLQDPASRHLSILGVAYECGFNSEASFYRIFKAATGLSPKEYISEGKKDSQNGF
jgi:AraC-like DNA-binding protein